MSGLIRTIPGGGIAAVYLVTALITRSHAVGDIDKGLAIVAIYSVGPLFSAIGIYLLYQFSLSAIDRLTGRFNPSSLRSIRWAGVAFAGTAFVKTMEQAMVIKLTGLKTTPLPGFDPSEMLLFLVIGFAFIALSNAGRYLLRNMSQMRDELNDIV